MPTQCKPHAKTISESESERLGPFRSTAEQTNGVAIEHVFVEQWKWTATRWFSLASVRSPNGSRSQSSGLSSSPSILPSSCGRSSGMRQLTGRAPSWCFHRIYMCTTEWAHCCGMSGCRTALIPCAHSDGKSKAIRKVYKKIALTAALDIYYTKHKSILIQNQMVSKHKTKKCGPFFELPVL